MASNDPSRPPKILPKDNGEIKLPKDVKMDAVTVSQKLADDFDDVDCRIIGASITEKDNLRPACIESDPGYASQNLSSLEEYRSLSKEESRSKMKIDPDKDIDTADEEDPEDIVTIKLQPTHPEDDVTTDDEQKTTTQMPESGLKAAEGTESNSRAVKYESKCDTKKELAKKLIAALQLFSITGDVFPIMLVLRQLTPSEDDNGDNCVQLAIIHKQPDVVREILRAVSTMDFTKVINHSNHLRQAPVHLAVIVKDFDSLRLLLDLSPDLTLVDRHGNTAIHIAASNADQKSLEILLTHIKNITPEGETAPELDTLNYDGYGALHLAVRARSLPCVKLLTRSRVCNVNLRDGKSGSSPLHVAVDMDNLSIVGHLTQTAKADVNAPRFDGNTPLHLSVSMKLVAMTALLMAGGADPTLENTEPINDSSDDDLCEEEEERIGHTPEDLAQENPKLLAILKGELMGKKHEDNDGLVDSGCCLMGNMSTIDQPTRLSLSTLLNKPKLNEDWRRLASLLECDLVMSSLASMPNPTKSLLDYYQSKEGTVETLRESLWLMGRHDALSIIDASNTCTTDTCDNIRSVDTLDSGIEQSFRSLQIK